MNPSKLGQLPYTYIAMTNFVWWNCIGKFCRVTITLETSELNKVTGWLCEILPTGWSRAFIECTTVVGPSAQKPTSDPATNVVCIRQAKKQLNNPNKDLAVPDATTAWKEVRPAWLHSHFCETWPGGSICLINITVKYMPSSCLLLQLRQFTPILAITLLKKTGSWNWLPQWCANIKFPPTSNSNV